MCVAGAGGGVNKLSSKFQRIDRQIVSQDGQTGFLLISLICHLILINRTWIDPRGSKYTGYMFNFGIFVCEYELN